jgi:adenylosuccinate lyase
MEAFEGKKKLLDVLRARKEVAALFKKGELEKLMDPNTYIGEAVEIVEAATKQ